MTYNPSNVWYEGSLYKVHCLGSVSHASLLGSAIPNAETYTNFILYGLIDFTEAVYLACDMTDAIIAYATRKLGTRPKVKNHPLFKIF